MNGAVEADICSTWRRGRTDRDLGEEEGKLDIEERRKDDMRFRTGGRMRRRTGWALRKRIDLRVSGKKRSNGRVSWKEKDEIKEGKELVGILSLSVHYISPPLCVSTL